MFSFINIWCAAAKLQKSSFSFIERLHTHIVHERFLLRHRRQQDSTMWIFQLNERLEKKWAKPHDLFIEPAYATTYTSLGWIINKYQQQKIIKKQTFCCCSAPTTMSSTTNNRHNQQKKASKCSREHDTSLRAKWKKHKNRRKVKSWFMFVGSHRPLSQQQIA